MGLLGGLFVGVTVLDLGPVEYLQQTQGAVDLRHVVIVLVVVVDAVFTVALHMLHL